MIRDRNEQQIHTHVWLLNTKCDLGKLADIPFGKEKLMKQLSNAPRRQRLARLRLTPRSLDKLTDDRGTNAIPSQRTVVTSQVCWSILYLVVALLLLSEKHDIDISPYYNCDKNSRYLENWPIDTRKRQMAVGRRLIQVGNEWDPLWRDRDKASRTEILSLHTDLGRLAVFSGKSLNY